MNLQAAVIVRFLIFSYSVVTVLGQIDSSCRATNRAAVPTNWRVLLDSNDYSFLFQSPSPSWLRSDVDGDGMQFTEIGGLCTRVLSACPSNFVATGNEDNWVFTSHTSYGSAKEIFVNVTYSYPACFGSCHPYVTLYRYDTSVPVPAGRTTTSNYQLLTGSETTSRFGSASTSSMIQETGVSRPSSFTGFYLGIRDTGTCGFPVQRVIIYYKVCEAKTGELVTLPEEALPLESAGSGVYSGRCVPNASAVTSLMVDINSVTGSCTERATGGARCECDAGYYRFNGTFCEACGVNQYRASTQSQTCRSCPLNSEARVEGSAICQCLPGYYRNNNPQEGPVMPCSQPPGPVGNLMSTATTSDSVTISWDRPSSLGGRNDYYYSIEHSDPRGSASSTITANSRLQNTNSRVTYTVSNLLPFEAYNIRVIAHNGVSDQEPSTAASRTRSIDATTREAAPGPVTVTALCSAIVWQAPATPNGVITSYQVDLGGVMTLPADRFFIVTSEQQQNSNVPARVRAVNGAGPGIWTPISGICPNQCSYPLNTSDISSTSASLSWSRPSSASGDVYSVEIRAGAMVESDTLTDGGQTVSHTLSDLRPFTSYSVEVSMGSERCGATFRTLEGAPSSPREFISSCSIIAWKVPSEINGVLTGYELQFLSEEGEVTGAVNLGAFDTYYKTNESQKRAGIKVRVRAVNGAGPGSWTQISNVCPDPCSLPFTTSDVSSTSASLSWSRPASASGNVYSVEIRAGAMVESDTLTDGGQTVSHNLSDLRPFTSYTVEVSMGSERCRVTFRTLEGVPSSPREFKPTCSIVAWKVPSEINGVLKGYELQFQSSEDKKVIETLYLGPIDTHYKTTDNLMKLKIEVRVRANNTNNQGTWTSFYSTGCGEATASSTAKGVFTNSPATDILIIVVITIVVCTVIFIFIVFLVYTIYKYRSKKDGNSPNSNKHSTNSDVKLNNLY